MKDTNVLRKHTLDPGDINPYVIGLVHKYWDLLSEQYDLDIKMDQNDWPKKWLKKHGSASLTYVSCIYYVQSKCLTLYLVGGQYQNGFAFFNGELDQDTINLWPLKDMLYNFKRIYSLINTGATLCATSVHKPSAHEVAAALQMVDMIEKWRVG